ncbi:MAG: HD domain-containing protein [Desulfobacteraceae bacterium]|nr:HD domain-containing protein [Desulfobacteraceae bacterium]
MDAVKKGVETEYFNDGSAFRAIDPLSINPDYLTDFSLFERYPMKKKQYRFRCLLVDSTSIPKERLIELLKAWKVVYIHKEQEQNYTAYIKENLEFILRHEDIDIKQKTNTLTELSTEVIQDVFETSFNKRLTSTKVVENVQKLVSKAIDFISSIDSLNGLANLIGYDYDTHTHSIKVGWLLATFINANKDLFSYLKNIDFSDFIVAATVAGFLHDIGKVKIPQHILNKNGKLDNKEYILMQSHTAYSVSMLFENNLPRSTMQAILYHHENEDGSGYPCGLIDNDIPLLAKICHVIDVFDALTSRRPYKEPKTPFDALKIMTESNPHLDALQKFENEVAQNVKTPVTAIVRNEPDPLLRRLREKDILEQEAKKRVKVRVKLRDQGMAHCFNADILKRFIVTINKSDSFQLSGLIL